MELLFAKAFAGECTDTELFLISLAMKKCHSL